MTPTNGDSNSNHPSAPHHDDLLKDESHQAAIAAERSKCNISFREELAPGLTIDMDLKNIHVMTHSKYQKVDVLETYFGKTLITDGKTQSSQFDEFAYHESLVHPSLLKAFQAGSSNKQIFIGGGGELATAREVLRHPSVEKVVMVDLDEIVVQVSRKYLPEWGGEEVASNPRLELIIGDAHAYLMETKDTFDVIIMDISDPIEAGPGVMLYTQEFYAHAKTLLNQPHGVFVTQAGTAESVPAAIVDVAGVDTSCYAPITNTLHSVFDCVVPYSVNIPSYGGDWGFVMAFQSTEDGHALDDWKAPKPGVIDELIEKQINGGSAALQWYDGVTHLRMFNLPKPLRKYMEKDGRIMTRDNPVFMY